VEPPTTQYHAESSDGNPNFEWRAADAGLKPLAAAHPRSVFAFRNTARALAAGSPRQDQVQRSIDESFHFRDKKINKLRYKLDSTENPRLFEEHPTPP